jgi:hypothetical protein
MDSYKTTGISYSFRLGIFSLLSEAELQRFEDWAVAREKVIDEEDFRSKTRPRLETSPRQYTEEQIRSIQNDMMSRHRATLVRSGTLMPIKALVDTLPYCT